MANFSSHVIDAVIVEEEIVFSLSGLCRAAGASTDQVLALVDEGVLQPDGDAPQHWAFRGPSLRIARMAWRLNADLSLGTAGSALVLDLLQEISELRARLRRAGLE